MGWKYWKHLLVLNPATQELLQAFFSLDQMPILGRRWHKNKKIPKFYTDGLWSEAAVAKGE